MEKIKGETVAFFLPSLRGGGAERVIVTIANEFAELGIDVDLLVAFAEGPFLDRVHPSVSLVHFGDRRVLKSFPKLFRYLSEKRPKALISAMKHANLVAIAAHIASRSSARIILSEHSTISASVAGTGGFKTRLMPLLMRILYQHADFIVGVSNGVCADIKDRLRLSENKIKMIYNPIINNELQRSAKEEVNHPWLNQKQFPVILAAGRFTAAKDYETLVSACKLLAERRPFRLIILGEGEDRDSIEEQIRIQGLSRFVDLRGFVKNPYPYMRECDVFVLSSKWEGLGNVLIEAMACGAKIVSTDCRSGPREILNNGEYGYLVPVGDPKALASAISQSLDSDWRAIPEAHLEQFSVRNVVRKYLDLL